MGRPKFCSIEDMVLLVTDERGDVFFPGKQNLLATLEPTGVFVCMALHDDRLGRSNDDDELNDVSDLLD